MTTVWYAGSVLALTLGVGLVFNPLLTRAAATALGAVKVTSINVTNKIKNSAGDIFLDGNVQIDGALSDPEGKLVVNDKLRVKDTVSLDGDFAVTGNSAFSGADGDLTTPDASFVGYVDMNGTLDVTDATVTGLPSTLVSTDSSGNATITGTMTAGSISVADAALGTGTVSSTEVADVVRSMPLQINGFNSFGLPLGASNGTTGTGMMSSSGGYYVLRFTNTGNSAISTNFMVPQDYSSGGQIVARVGKSAETTGDETLSILYLVDNTSASTAVPTIITGTDVQNVTKALSSPTISAGSAIALTLSSNAANDNIYLYGIEFQYTATQ